jgi:hypothetical protein
MDFRLTYEGILKGASRHNQRPAHKHDIRRIFHRQLKRLFEIHPAFESLKQPHPDGGGDLKYERVIMENENFGFRFFPLATRALSLRCTVRILFLRPDMPGAVIASGDIDNRIKTIFDALRLPHSGAELGGHVPQDGEDPFYCLLEDDSLIDRAEIETDTLLEPVSTQPNRNDARIVLTITLRPIRVTFENIGFG